MILLITWGLSSRKYCTPLDLCLYQKTTIKLILIESIGASYTPNIYLKKFKSGFIGLYINISTINNKYTIYKPLHFTHITTGVFCRILSIVKSQKFFDLILCYSFVSRIYLSKLDVLVNQHLFNFRLPLTPYTLYRVFFQKFPLYFRRYRRVKRWLYKSFLKNSIK